MLKLTEWKHDISFFYHGKGTHVGLYIPYSQHKNEMVIPTNNTRRPHFAYN